MYIYMYRIISIVQARHKNSVERFFESNNFLTERYEFLLFFGKYRRATFLLD